MKLLQNITNFIEALLFILGVFYLSHFLYQTFVGHDILYGFCSGEGCIGFLLFAILPIAAISATIFVFLIRIFKKRGVIYSSIILLVLVITPMIVSGQAEYLRASNWLQNTIYAMGELDKQIIEISAKEGSQGCFTHDSYQKINSLPYPEGPMVNGVRDSENFYFADGNGITATTYFNEFNLFKLSDDKVVGNVHVSVQPIRYTNSFYRAKKFWHYKEKYMPYVYLNYKNSIILKYEDKAILRENASERCSGIGYKIRNAGKENGKPVIVFSLASFH